MDFQKEPKSETYRRRTKLGNVVSVLRERYLRTDIRSHIGRCRKCCNEGIQDIPRTATRIVIIDSIVATRFSEVVEQGNAEDVVVLQTVFEQSPSVIRRLCSPTITQKDIHCVYFCK